MGKSKAKKRLKLWKPRKIQGLEIITEQLSNGESYNESSLKKIQGQKNPRHLSGAPEKITSKMLTLLNMSFGFLSKKISIYEAKIFLKTLNNTRSILKTYLKTIYPPLEPKKSKLNQDFPNIDYEFMNQIRDLLEEPAKKYGEQNTKHQEECSATVQTLEDRISLMEEEIAIKNQNLKNLEDKHSGELKLTKFWREKFSESITKSAETQYFSLEDTSFNNLCQLASPEPNMDTTEPVILKGDICSTSPLRTRDLSLIELRINDYKCLKGTKPPVTTTRPHESSQTRESLLEKKPENETATSEEKSLNEGKGQKNIGKNGRKGRNKRKKKK